MNRSNLVLALALFSVAVPGIFGFGSAGCGTLVSDVEATYEELVTADEASLVSWVYVDGGTALGVAGTDCAGIVVDATLYVGWNALRWRIDRVESTVDVTTYDGDGPLYLTIVRADL